MSIKVIFDLALFFFEKKKSSCILPLSPTSFVAGLLLLPIPPWASQQDDAQIQMKLNVILDPFEVEGQFRVVLQTDVLV